MVSAESRASVQKKVRHENVKNVSCRIPSTAADHMAGRVTSFHWQVRNKKKEEKEYLQKIQDKIIRSQRFYDSNLIDMWISSSQFCVLSINGISRCVAVRKSCYNNNLFCIWHCVHLRWNKRLFINYWLWLFFCLIWQKQQSYKTI